MASYSLGFWALVVLIGLVAGLAGALLILLLQWLQHLVWNYHSGVFLGGVQAASAGHRVLVLAGAGAIAGTGALVLRRLRGFGGGEVSEAVWRYGGRMPVVPSVSRGVLSIVVVALGASLGREAAPQLTGGALASWLCELIGLPPWQRQLLVACGAGAGMAAVYNVPLGGALFALEVLLGTLSIPLVIPALLASVIATAIAWVALPTAPTYRVPSYGVTGSQIVFAAIIGPLAGLAAISWVRLVAAAHRIKLTGRWRAVIPILVLTGVGLTSIAYPQLLGNGKDTVQLAILGAFGVGTLFALTLLKPAVTAACLGSGAPGGLFTPTLAYGVLFGGLLGHFWGLLWPGAATGSYAIIAGGAVLAAAMQGPLAAVVLMLELARHSDALIVPLLLAVAGATVVARTAGAASIYSARLGEPPVELTSA